MCQIHNLCFFFTNSSFLNTWRFTAVARFWQCTVRVPRTETRPNSFRCLACLNACMPAKVTNQKPAGKLPRALYVCMPGPLPLFFKYLSDSIRPSVDHTHPSNHQTSHSHWAIARQRGRIKERTIPVSSTTTRR